MTPQTELPSSPPLLRCSPRLSPVKVSAERLIKGPWATSDALVTEVKRGALLLDIEWTR